VSAATQVNVVVSRHCDDDYADDDVFLTCLAGCVSSNTGEHCYRHCDDDYDDDDVFLTCLVLSAHDEIRVRVIDIRLISTSQPGVIHHTYVSCLSGGCSGHSLCVSQCCLSYDASSDPIKSPEIYSQLSWSVLESRRNRILIFEVLEIALSGPATWLNIDVFQIWQY